MPINDKGGRRSWLERRQSFSVISFFDRRSGDDRRSGLDRRSGYDRRSPEGFRFILGIDRRRSFVPAIN